MKINKENMKGLAEKLDVAKPPTLEEVGITKDDICNMAYQIQYFFEAMEKLKLLPGSSTADSETVYWIIDLFDNTLIDKVPA